MFSGIIETLGTVKKITPSGQGQRLLIQSSLLVSPDAGVGKADRSRVGLGDSIAINGACLTVERIEGPDLFEVTCGAESLSKTTLGMLKIGQLVHLERALRMGDRLDGHLVQGHVDGVADVISCERAQESVIIWLHCPMELVRYIAVKGSVTLAGVSLTVNEIEGSRFRVNVVPYTADETLLGRLGSGMRVNLEVDVLARYVERLLHPESGLTFSRLSELGYGRSHARGGSK